jgi:myo-inositol 2-dehydrogenase / D-chiro-inositol 1-dehydrogenase
MSAPLPVAILGAGRIGQVHARTIAHSIPGAWVVGVADPRLDAAQALATELGIPKVCGDPLELIADPGVAAVLVCSSTDTHADLVIAAARAGKHVFCEKPLDLDLARIDAVLAEVERAGVQLMLGFNRRFDPDFARVQALVASGAVGRPEMLRITSRDPSPPPAEYVAVSGGMFLDMTIHDFDMARFAMGQEVVVLHTMAAVLVDPAIGAAGDVDSAVISLRFADGALGVIENSRRAVYGYDQRIEVLGSGGRVGNRNLAADTVQLADASGLHDPLPLDFFMQRYTAAYAAEIRAFIEAVQGDRAPAVGGHDGRMAVVLGLAAKRSLELGRPVRVDEITA